jgi:hypothetical protein
MFLVKILNLQRRPDRRKWMESTMFVDSELTKLEYVLAADGNAVYFEHSYSTTCIDHNGLVFCAEKNWPLSAQELKNLQMRWVELGYTDPDEGDLLSYYSRPVNTGELACFASHHAAWSAAEREWKAHDEVESGSEHEDVLIVFEDDVTAVPFLTSEQYVHHMHWREVRLRCKFPNGQYFARKALALAALRQTPNAFGITRINTIQSRRTQNAHRHVSHAHSLPPTTHAPPAAGVGHCARHHGRPARRGPGVGPALLRP